MFVAFLAVASFVAGAVVYYFKGQKAVSVAVNDYAKFRDKISAEGQQAHSELLNKYSAVKAEVSKIEGEGKAEEKAVVARLKALL